MAASLPNDVVTDAEPENNSTEEGHHVTIEELWNENKQTYLLHFDPKLKYEPIDILIIHSKKNCEAAKKFRDSIANNVRFNLGEGLCNQIPNVVLYDDFITKNNVKLIEQFLDSSHYIFIYVTEEFCKDYWKQYETYICTRVEHEKGTHSSVVFVHTCTKERREYHKDFPLIFLHHPGEVEEYDQNLHTRVKDMLQRKSKPILEKRSKTEKLRFNYFKANYGQIFSTVNTLKNPGEPNAPPINTDRCIEMLQRVSISEAVFVECEGKGDSPEQNAQLFHKGQDLYSTDATQKNSRSTAVVTPTVRHSSHAEPDSSNNVLYGTDLADLL